MSIERINTYLDSRFSQTVLNQHGCFLIEGEPYEVEILSDHEALVRGREVAFYPDLIEEFRFYTPHITVFYNKQREIIRQFPSALLITLSLEEIQPSQFYVDAEKVAAVSTFLACPKDIIIQVFKDGERYISLDGHTRLYYAVTMGWTHVRAVETDANAFMFKFAEEARRRNVFSPYDLPAIPHEDYEIKWNKFCDEFLSADTEL